MGRKSITNYMVNHSISGKALEDFVHNVLTKNYFKVHREVVVQSQKFLQKMQYRKIDIKFVYGKMTRYMEVDGKIHGDLEQPTLSTLQRTAHSERETTNYILSTTHQINTHSPF